MMPSLPAPLNRLTGPTFDIRDKVVLVTGAGQGIGRELVGILYRRGALIAAVDIDEAAARKAADDLGSRAHGIGADVTDRSRMDQVIGEVVDRFGRLDIVVANAGVSPTPATLRTMEPDDFDRVLNINLTGVFNTVHPALDEIVRTGGHVVVVSSCAAFAPGMGGSPYMISKAAVEQLGRALRVELGASGATAGIAYFGLVETSMTHAVLDADDLGRRINDLLPWPLSVRITAEQAARTIADGISRRAARTVAPGGWQPYLLLRGVINTVLDSRLTADSTVHDIVRTLENRR